MIGTITPGLSGDTLSLTQTGGNGILSLGSVQANGTQQVIYTAGSNVAASGPDAVSYTVSDKQHNDAVAKGSASVQLDAGPTIKAATPSVVEKSQTTVIGTVTPGLRGDTLSLTQTGGNGILSLGTVQANGTQQVLYTAGSSIASSSVDAVSYTISDQHQDAVTKGSASVQLDAGPIIAAATPSVVEQGQTTVIGTVTPGLSGDALSLTQTGGSGILSLGTVQANGTQQVLYTAGSSIASSSVDAVSYTISDQHQDAVAKGSASVQLDAGPIIAAATPSVVEKGQTTVIGTVTPGLSGDTLSLTQTGGNGILSLSTVQANGTQQVLYTAGSSIASSNVDAVSYTVSDQHQDAVAKANASIQLDAGPTITAAAPSVVEQGQTTVVGTVKPGLTSDTLTLTQTAGSGVLSLGSVQANGTQQIIYTAGSSIATSSLDAVSYTVSDQHQDALAKGSASVQLDAGPTIAAATPSVLEQGQTTIIGTFTPGLSGDTLSLTQTGGSGILSLGTVQANGTPQVLYTAGSSIASSSVDAVSYTVSDQHQDAVAQGSGSVQLDPGPTITAAAPSVVEQGQTTVVGTVKPGLTGDTPTLTQTAGSGVLSLGTVQADGTQQVIYTAGSNIATSSVDPARYTVSDQHQDAVAQGSASVQLDPGPSITAATPSVVRQGQTTVIGTVTPGLSGDTLTLTQTGGSGILSLGTVQADGTQQIIYTAGSTIATSRVDAVSYTVSDQHQDAVAQGSASVQLDAGPTVVPGSTTATGSITELPNNTNSTTVDTTSGKIAFADVDVNDRPTASVTGQTISAVAADGITPVTFTTEQVAALEDAFSIASESANTNNGTIDWTYSIPDSSLGFLDVGETVTLTSTVQIDDGHGDQVSQPVTVTITGNREPITAMGTPGGNTITIPMTPGQIPNAAHSDEVGR